MCEDLGCRFDGPLEQFNPHSSGHPVNQACWSSNIPGECQQQRRQAGGLQPEVLSSPVVELGDGDHKEEVTCVSFNSNDSLVASGSSSGDLPIHALRLSPLRRSLLGSVSDSGSVVLWDSNTQKELHAFDGAHKAPGSGSPSPPPASCWWSAWGWTRRSCATTRPARCEERVLRSIRVDSPLTAVDFSPDGTGLVVGSTQGKILHYDLRNSSAPTRVTAAHKTSVTCLRFQSSSSKLKPSSKLGSTKIVKRSSSTKLSSSQPDSSPSTAPAPSTGPAPHRQVTGTGGAAAEVLTREEPLPVGEKFSRVGRNSLDSLVHRKTPLGTPLTAGRCYSPLSVFQTPPPIKEEEPITAAAESCDPGRLKGSSSSLEGEGSTPPTSPQLTNHSQPAPPFFTPELRRANGIQAQLNYEDVCHRDIVNLQVEMVRQFYIQLRLCERVSGGGGGETEGGEPPAEDQLLTSDQYHRTYYGMGESANLSKKIKVMIVPVFSPDVREGVLQLKNQHVQLKPNTQNHQKLMFKTRYFSPSDGHVPLFETMANPLRSEVVRLYKNLLYLGREYPKGSEYFRDLRVPRAGGALLPEEVPRHEEEILRGVRTPGDRETPGTNEGHEKRDTWDQRGVTRRETETKERQKTPGTNEGSRKETETKERHLGPTRGREERQRETPGTTRGREERQRRKRDTL
ncbi:hypothetical protein F7725_023493 [Dissostichus mawsoni]|uniref:Uncharacterized protein n=1 Tax=Dissostichus mawsoni TaxID=36200 RepID=A0A7J5Z553_DISMA|nr:hypothetical protein F7725_023493 [Dissostichus mawsoni]